MPKYEVTYGSSMLDVALTPTEASTGEIEVDGTWTSITVVELSKKEIADWERVRRAYHAWAHRIQEMRSDAWKTAPRWPNV